MKLTKETIDQLLNRQSKELLELQSTDEVKDVNTGDKPTVSQENTSTTDVDKIKQDDWKDGYIDYEVKTKKSDRISYKPEEIEIIEEDF